MPRRIGTVRLACDECGTNRQAKPGVPIEQLRDGLVEVGWYCDADQDLDLCPVHAEAYVERVL